MQEDSLLQSITGPQSLKNLPPEQLEKLCGEIRRRLIGTVSRTGGHLASNLGVVELTVALHRVFSSPRDQIVWDVSHQCYTHKLLTGRCEEFDTLRQFGGISGFTKPGESVHDVFQSGHSSTSISAAAGLARAKTLKKEEGFVVAVIGDGSLSGGLAYEGLNNAGRSRDRLIIILNDNTMSISKNVGAMARHLAIIRAKPLYFTIKDNIEAFVSHIPLVGGRLRDALFRGKSLIKNALYHSTIFEEMGFAYLGPADGNDIEEVCRLLTRAKNLRRPSLIHLMTVKGKGYPFAEADPGAFHGVGRFDVETGKIQGGGAAGFSQVFGKSLAELARGDDRICAVTAAMRDGTGLDEFAGEFSPRFFDVGIAEEHAVVFSAGLARNGMLPVFAVYSTFLQRAYDQILHDVALQKLKVVFAVDRAGLVGEDGETHQGIFDVSFLNSIPGLTVYSPCCFRELQSDLQAALYECKGPAAVRYPRGAEPALPEDFVPEKGAYRFYGDPGAELLLVTYGRLFAEAAKAVPLLAREGMRACVLRLNRIKPVDREAVRKSLRYENVVFFEESVKTGGVGEHFLSLLTEEGYKGGGRVFAVPDLFVRQGGVPQLLKMLGLDARGMCGSVLRTFRRESVTHSAQ